MSTQAIGWGWAVAVWGYAVAWWLVNDRIKLIAYRILAPEGSVLGRRLCSTFLSR